MNYQISECGQHCAGTGRELVPGEEIYVVLYDCPDGWRREDWSKGAWQGPPPEAFSFWVSHAPSRAPAQRLLVDDDALLANLHAWAESADPAIDQLRYVVSLLLLRRKRLKLDRIANEDGQDWLMLKDPRTKSTHRVLDPRLSEQAIAEVQEKLEKQLSSPLAPLGERE